MSERCPWMRVVRFTLMWCVLGGFGLIQPAAEARVIRVPVNYPTIQAAVNAASAGDTVIVSPGKYRERVTLKGGVRLHAVKTLEGNVSPASSATDVLSQDVVIDARGVPVQNGNKYVIGWSPTTSRIEVVGFTVIAEGGVGILVRGANHLIEQNKMFAAAADSAISIPMATNCTIVGNHAGHSIDFTTGIDLLLSSQIYLTNNVAEGESYAIRITGGRSNLLQGNLAVTTGAFYNDAILLDSTGAWLQNNTAFATDAAGLRATALHLRNGAGADVINCILVAPPQAVPAGQPRISYGVLAEGGSSANLSYSDVVGGTRPISGVGVALGGGVINADPLFVDFSAFDFRLQPLSLALHHGAGGFNRDGTTPADMGAYGGIF